MRKKIQKFNKTNFETWSKFWNDIKIYFNYFYSYIFTNHILNIEYYISLFAFLKLFERKV